MNRFPASALLLLTVMALHVVAQGAGTIDAAQRVFTSNDGFPNKSPYSIDLATDRDTAGLAPSDAAIDFGRIRLGRPAYRTIQLRNGALQALRTITAISHADGSSPFGVTEPFELPSDLAALGSGNLTVSFSPAQAGAFADTLLIFYSPDDRVLRIAVAGVAGKLAGANLVVALSGPRPDSSLYPIGANAIVSSVGVSKNALSFSLPPCAGTTMAEDTLTIFNTGTAPIDIRGIAISGSPAFTLIAPQPTTFTLAPGGSRPVRVRYTSSGPGSATGTLIFVTTDPERDSVLVDLAGSSDTALLVPSASPLAFPGVPSCLTTTKLKFVLYNRGSVTDTLKTVNINAPFIVLLPLKLTIPPGDSAVIDVTFAPGSDGAYSTQLIYAYASGNCSLIDSVLVTAARMSASYGIAGADFGDVTVGSTGSASATVFNRNGTAIRIGSADIIPPSAEIAIAPGQFPMTVPPGGSAPIALLYTPATVGSIPAGTIIRVHVDSLCRTDLDSVVTGRGIPGGIGTNRGSITFDAILGCRSADSIVVVRNSGKAPVTVTSATIGPFGAGKFFTVAPALVQPVTLAPADSLVLTVRFIPGPGPDSAIGGALTITTNDPLRPTLTVTLAGHRLAQALALRGGGFGTVGAGSTTSIRRWIVNTGSAPVRVRDLTTAAPFRVVSSLPSPPTTIPPGDSIEVTLEFFTAVPGSYADSIRVGVEEACDSFALPISAIAEDRSIILGEARWGDASGAPGDTISIPLTLETPLDVAGVRSITAGARFNPSLLRPIEIALAGTIIGNWRVAPPVIARGRVLFTAAGETPLTGTGPIARLRALVLLGDSIATPVAGGDSSGVDAPRGSLTILPGTFTLSGYCTTGGPRLVAGGGAFGLKGIVPNPVGATAQVAFSTVEEGRTELLLVDPLGHESARLVDAVLPPRTYIVTLSATGFPSGVYYLELRSGTQVAREKIIIVR